jgi:hypothetical protein
LSLLSKEEFDEHSKDVTKSKKLSNDYWGSLPADLRDKISSLDNSGETITVPQDNLPTSPHDSPPSNERKGLDAAYKTNDPSSSLKTNGNFSSEDSISNNLDSIKDNKTNTKSQEGTNNDTTDGQVKDKSDWNTFGRFWEADIKSMVKREKRDLENISKGIINLLSLTMGVKRSKMDTLSEILGERKYEATNFKSRNR